MVDRIPYRRQHFLQIGFFVLYILDEIVHFFYGDTEEANILHHQGRSGGACERRHSEVSPGYGATEARSLLHAEKQPPYNPSFYRTQSDSALFDQPPSQLCHVGHQEPCQSVSTANIGLLAALSVHALIEGLVVGLETRSEKVLLLLGAIASHKLVVAFCLGMELASNSSYSFMKHLLCILIFSAGSVLGIVVGMMIYSIPGEIKYSVIPILQALSGGTLLYVTVSEIIPRERARWHQQHEKKAAGLVQFSSVFLGFAMMTLLSNYLDYDA
ncbi:unnamed protein product [Phyllotreta striolata]|uniref:Uncharacterized protein n=1 Tax=Phyllotreta striolata TaxID=444603 RepID=A0A9N9XPQ5_PHYSR|nr:unnamed protein product [Phyllotreta striolata]